MDSLRNPHIMRGFRLCGRHFFQFCRLYFPYPELTDSAAHSKVSCESLAGLTIAAKSIGLPTSGAAVGAAELIPLRRKR
jgi:hypothetical protein